MFSDVECKLTEVSIRVFLVIASYSLSKLLNSFLICPHFFAFSHESSASRSVMMMGNQSVQIESILSHFFSADVM